jgi:hypothetical protein
MKSGPEFRRQENEELDSDPEDLTEAVSVRGIREARVREPRRPHRNSEQSKSLRAIIFSALGPARSPGSAKPKDRDFVGKSTKQLKRNRRYRHKHPDMRAPHGR